jgi:xanthine dehydrogenase molybdopterin-binding subunit B
MIDDISRHLGKDPLEVRKINLYAGDGGRHITHYGQAVEQPVLGDIISRLEKSSGYQARREGIIRFNRENRLFRKGIALTPVKFGISFSAQHLNQAGALLHVYTDGSIHLNHGGTEMGQGLLIKVAQVVAQEFQIPLDKVIVSAARTDKVPNTPPTAASSGSDLNGMAARAAAHRIKAGPVVERQAAAWLGAAWRGDDGRGSRGEDWSVPVTPGGAGLGAAWQAWSGLVWREWYRPLRHIEVWQPWRGHARHGTVRYGQVRQSWPGEEESG